MADATVLRAPAVVASPASPARRVERLPARRAAASPPPAPVAAPPRPERRSYRALYRVTVATLLLGIVGAGAVLVLVRQSQTREKEAFSAALDDAGEALVAVNDMVFGAVRAVDPVRPDLEPVRRAAETAEADLLKRLIPVTTGRYAEESTALLRAYEGEQEFLTTLSVFATPPATRITDAQGDQLLQRWKAFLDASHAIRMSGNRPLSFDALTPQLTTMVSAVVARADEARAAEDLSQRRESTRTAQRAAVQRYHDDMVTAFDRYEALREELPNFNRANERIETHAQYQAFRTRYASASSARSAIASQMRSISAPAAFTTVHNALPSVLDRLARAVNDAQRTADEAFLCSPKPCPTIFETPAFKAYVVAGEALYDEYSRLQADWVRLYESEIRRLYAP